MADVEKDKPLTPKMERFAEEYLKDLNATQAATRAGFSEKTAQEQGSRLLKDPRIKELVQRGMDERSRRTEISADEVLTSIYRIAKKAEDAAEFVAALKGQELLGKHLKLFTEKHEFKADDTLSKLLAESWGSGK